MTGSDVPICSPSHPYSVAMQTKNVIDRIHNNGFGSDDEEYEFNCNSYEGVRMFETYGKMKGLTIQFFINGRKATYEQVVADFNRGSAYVNMICGTTNKQ